MYASLKPILREELAEIHRSGLHKAERVITSRQGRLVCSEGREVLNFCSNNYLGLAGSDDMVAAARDALETFGFGLSSVRFICGTQDIHVDLERSTARFLGMDDAILYSSCMSANIGFFARYLASKSQQIGFAGWMILPFGFDQVGLALKLETPVDLFSGDPERAPWH